MTRDDRDMLLMLLVVYKRMTAIVKDETSELCLAYKHKISTSAKMIRKLFKQYEKREGVEALYELIIESSKHKLVMHAKTDNLFDVNLQESNYEPIR